MSKSTAVTIALAGVWGGVVLVSLLAPDLVSGSEQEHLPLAAITAWIWGLAASGYVIVLAVSTAEESTIWRSLATSVPLIWLLAALLGILGPQLETGSDPTKIPLAALIAPPVATLATAAACVLAVTLRPAQAPQAGRA